MGTQGPEGGGRRHPMGGCGGPKGQGVGVPQHHDPSGCGTKPKEVTYKVEIVGKKNLDPPGPDYYPPRRNQSNRAHKIPAELDRYTVPPAHEGPYHKKKDSDYKRRTKAGVYPSGGQQAREKSGRR